MIRSDFSRVDPKRRAALDHKKTQFAKPQFKEQDYVHSLNFYEIPPTAEITLEEFEVWAINRLKGAQNSWVNIKRPMHPYSETSKRFSKLRIEE